MVGSGGEAVAAAERGRAQAGGELGGGRGRREQMERHLSRLVSWAAALRGKTRAKRNKERYRKERLYLKAFEKS